MELTVRVFLSVMFGFSWILAATPGSMTPALATGSNPGISGVWASTPSSADAARLTTLQSAWTRVSLVWSQVQPLSSATYDWSAYDQAVANASGGGARNVVIMVRDNPTWAARDRCQVTSTGERALLATFAAAVVTRYKGAIPDGPLAGQVVNVKYWQFYNEADNTSVAFDAATGLGGCFGTLSGNTPTADGRDNYARMIESVAPAVHAADPSANVVTSPIVSSNWTDDPYCTSGCIFDHGFLPGVLSRLKSDGALGQVDALSVHYYSSQAGYTSQFGTDLIGRIGGLRQDLLDVGLTADQLKPIILDEGAYTGAPYDAVSTASPTDPFNIAQRNYVVQVLARAAALNLRGYLWFWMQDASTGLGSDRPYGLTDVTGAPKPAYSAFRYFSSLVDSASRFVRTLEAPSKLEGYEFTTVDGRTVQIVWNQVDATQVAYAVPGSITSVSDPLGNAAGTNGPSSVMIGADPRFIFYTPFPQLSILRAGAGSGSVASSPGGISCGPTCAAPFAPGTAVTLTATPDTGSVFGGWTGACSGLGNCSFTMAAAQSITATFQPAFALSVSRVDAGTGTVTSSPAGIACGATCSAPMAAGTSVTLTETPAAGSVFTGWGGACSGSGSCSVAMSAAESVTASFKLATSCLPRPNVAVSATPDGPGRLRVVITDTGAKVVLTSIEFGNPGGSPALPQNALIDVGALQGISGGFSVKLPGGTTQTTVFIRRARAGAATTVPILITDSCSVWSTLVGGGPAAF